MSNKLSILRAAMSAGAFAIVTTSAARPAQAAARSFPSAVVRQATVKTPKAVDDVATYGEDLYDAAKAGAWSKASSLVAQLDKAAKALPAEPSVAAERARLATVVQSLKTSVGAKQKEASIVAANEATYLAAKLTAPYHPVQPIEVQLLDYYGRELEIWSSQKNAAKLKSTVADLRKTWDAVRPAVESHHGSAEVKKTDALVARIEAAKTPAEHARLAKPFLDEVDNLEKVFVK